MGSGGDTKLTRLAQWQAGGVAGPWEVLVMPTQRCNLACKHCWKRRVEAEIGANDLNDKAHEMPDQRWLDLVDECHALGVREWNIVGGGEPMVRGDLVLAMCEKIRGLGMNGVVHSNGTRFTQAHFERLIGIGWGRIAVSLDGPDREINDAIRGTGFDRATENLRLLDDLRRQRGVEAPRVNLACAVTNQNFDKLDSMVQLAHDTGCRVIGFSYLTDENDGCKDYDLGPEQRTEFPGHVARAIAMAERLGIEHNFADLLPPEPESGAPDVKEACNGGGGLMEALCYEVWLTAAIQVDGKVGPCCVSWDADADSIQDKPFEDVWYGPCLQGIRERIASRDAMPYCVKCPTFVTALSDRLRGQLARDAAWAAMGLPERAGYLGKRFASSLRRGGLKQTLRQTRTWIQGRLP